MRRVFPCVLGVALLFVTPVAAAEFRPGEGDGGGAVVFEGRVLVQIACDLEGGTAETSYQLETDDGARVALVLPAGAVGPVRSGGRFRVTGRLDGDRLQAYELEAVSDRSPLAIPAIESAWTTGTKKVLVILLKFLGETTTPYTQTQAQNVMFNATSSVKNLYAEASYSQAALVGDVTPWLTATVAKPTTCDTSTAASQATTRATAAGYVLSNYDLVVYAHTSMPCSWAGLAFVGASGAWINGGSFNPLVVGHELGHNFGLRHAHSLSCAGAMYSVGCDTTGSRSEYGDPFDTMGNSRSGHFNSYEKSSLDWMPAGSVATHPGGSVEYRLSAFEGTTGLRAVKVVAATGRTYWVEWRQPIGFDAAFPAGATTGAQVRIGPSRVGGSDLLDGSPVAGGFGDAALPLGITFLDAVASLSITPVSQGGGTLVLDVATVVPSPIRFHTVAPCRVADTRGATGPSGGPALAANTLRTFPVAGLCGIPAGARAVALNVTVTGSTAAGSLTLLPDGTVPTGTTTVSFKAGQTRANNAVVGLGPAGDVGVVGAFPSGTAHGIMDVSGYFQ